MIVESGEGAIGAGAASVSVGRRIVGDGAAERLDRLVIVVILQVHLANETTHVGRRSFRQRRHAVRGRHTVGVSLVMRLVLGADDLGDALEGGALVLDALQSRVVAAHEGEQRVQLRMILA